MKHLIRSVISAALPLLLLASCSTRDKIWNASDLAEWVQAEAVEQGYQPESIELEEWYRKDGERLMWHGTGVKNGSKNKSEFAVRVDEVWKPSSTE
jgi:hypothetical protein